jgi:hypothetical protein
MIEEKLKKAHLYRMEMPGVFAPIFWDVKVDIYGWSFTRGIV